MHRYINTELQLYLTPLCLVQRNVCTTICNVIDCTLTYILPCILRPCRWFETNRNMLKTVSYTYTAECCPALPKFVYSIHIPSTLQALWECSQNSVLRLKQETTNLRA